MNGYLLDTNIALLALADPDRIPSQTRQRIEDGPIHMSVISYWEVVLKTLKGKLDVGDPRSWWSSALTGLGAATLPFRPEHVSEVFDLPPIHKDPFDRALIAQATVEEMMFVTTDEVLRSYASKRFQVI